MYQITVFALAKRLTVSSDAGLSTTRVMDAIFLLSLKSFRKRIATCRIIGAEKDDIFLNPKLKKVQHYV